MFGRTVVGNIGVLGYFFLKNLHQRQMRKQKSDVGSWVIYIENWCNCWHSQSLAITHRVRPLQAGNAQGRPIKLEGQLRGRPIVVQYIGAKNWLRICGRSTNRSFWPSISSRVLSACNSMLMASRLALHKKPPAKWLIEHNPNPGGFFALAYYLVLSKVSLGTWSR